MKCVSVVACAGLLLASCTSEQSRVPVSAPPTESLGIEMQMLPASRTGVDFNNMLTDDGRLNVFVWNFLYSGAGVAAGDINNDGLPDLYFAGNQVSDRLYLNKGNFVFEDISHSAGIIDQLWSTGVTMADVNGDGLLDIYVCKNSASTKPNINKNKLYINLGGGRFEDQASTFGIDDIGFAVQASFFDVDNDGDLDLYLVNQPVDQFAQYVNPPAEVTKYPATDRLFLFENGRFTDVAERQGLANERYGLSVSLADFNLDGWTDLYISNDYHHADHLYINHLGQLRDEIRTRTGHTSFYAMGTDVGDINNDGQLDCIVLDMAFEDHYRSKTNMESMNPERFWSLVRDGQHYQYAVNTLQMNKGNGTFSEIAHLAGVAKTDWSWTPLLTDLDNDGYKDLVVTNGIARDMKNNDFTAYVAAKYAGRVGPDNYKEILQALPSVPVRNKLYRNNGTLTFSDISAAAGFDFQGFSHGMAYADLDQDGLLDLVVNNMNAPAGIYRNVTRNPGNYLIVALEGPGSNLNGQGLSVVLYSGGSAQIATMQTSRGYFSSSEPILHFGMGLSTSADSLKVIWNHHEMTVLRNVSANQRLSISYATAALQPYVKTKHEIQQFQTTEEIAFEHREQAFDDYMDQVLLPYQLSQNGPFLAVADVDANGLDDIHVGGAAGQGGALFLQTEQGVFHEHTSNVLTQNAQYEDAGTLFFDYDNDGDPDLYVVSGSNEFPEGAARLVDRLYTNDGSGNFTRDYQALPNDLRINGQAVVSGDFDGDGDQDLFVGGRLIAGKYPLPASSVLLINDAGRFKVAGGEICSCLEDFGLVTAAITSDVDGDGDQDILVVGEWMPPTILVNTDGHFDCRVIEEAGTGLWWSVQQGDFDGDGDQDYLLGNLGWNNKFGGAHAKLEVYAGDFDGNGDHDVVLATSNGSITLPVRGRECSTQEMPFVQTKFPSFDAFGKASINDLLTETQRNGSLHLKISTFSSVYLQNDGDFRFTVRPLPGLCQTGPIKAFATLDLNGDGNLDFIYVGNHYPTEVETARYDALVHGICYGDGLGDFTPEAIAGLSGDFRDVAILQRGNDFFVIVARNDGPLETFVLKKF